MTKKKKSNPAYNGQIISIILLIVLLMAISMYAFRFLIPVAWFMIFGLIICLRGFHIIEENTAFVYSYFGKKSGENQATGFWWTSPFTNRSRISLKKMSLTSHLIKGRDKNNVPITIGSTTTWKITSPSIVYYDFEDIEKSIRGAIEVSLHSCVPKFDFITEAPLLQKAFLMEVRKKEALLGITFINTEITHLNYAPEVAQMHTKTK